MKLSEKMSGVRNRLQRAFRNPVVFLLAAVCSIILFYALFAYSFYTAMKVKVMKEAYRTISEMDLADLDEEDDEILQGFSDERLEILITDDKFRPVYSNGLEQQGSQDPVIERYMVPYEELFQESPNIYIRKNENFRVIRLRGLVTQKQKRETEGKEPEGEVYYVYIRLLIRSVGVVIRYTTQYLCIAAILVFSLLYLLLRAKKESLAFVPLEEVKEGGAGAKSVDGAPDVKAQSEFMANVSHELKTPLAVISGQMEMLQSMGDRIDQNYYFTSIREEIDKMSRMVGNLLDLTIMEHQMENMEMREVDFSALAEYMAQKYDALFQRNGIRFSQKIKEGCIVCANRTYLEQAVNNYIMNAFQHTQKGKKIRISLAREKDCAKLCVYNEGSFLQPEQMGRIWSGFYMEPESKANLREFRNAGLGLHFVKKIVEFHHGEYGAQNTDDGVEFWLSIPLIG